MSVGVVAWWSFLCTAAALNVAVWSLAGNQLERRRTVMSVDTYAASRIQFLLSGVYVFGCAFRSVLPVFDIPRLGLFDTWLSSVAVGRSVATVAELCFAGQWAAMLGATAASVGGGVFARIVSVILVPLIVTAETCSWYAVLTTDNLAHVAENSLWGLSGALVIGGIVTVIPRYAALRRRAMLAWCLAGTAYVVFVFLFDVPMYWARWVADEVAGRHYMSIAQGLADVAHRRVVSYRWDDWKTEVVWMSLYFTTGVWCSISLIQVQARTHLLSAGVAVRLRSQLMTSGFR